MVASFAALIFALSCSKREDPPPAAATDLMSTPPAAAVARAPAAVPAIPEAPAASAGADLEKVAQNAAAFENMVASLRKFAGKDIGTNAATLDLDSFVRGKSEQELLIFAEAAQPKSPYAALQVLEHLWRRGLDFQIRNEVAGRLGDLAYEIGYAQDRALAYECMDWLIGVLGDPGQIHAMSDAERTDLLDMYHGLSITYALDAAAANRKKADALRRTARSELERAEADEYEVFALLNTGRIEDVPAARALMESLRAHDDPGFPWVDHWLSLDDATIAAEYRKLREIDEQFRRDEQRRFQRLDSLSPAERLLEIQRQVEETPSAPPLRKESP